MSDLPRGEMDSDDPREFGAGIETTSKERAWQKRAAFWREKAMMLGYDPEKHNGANVDRAEPEFHFVNVKPVIVSDAPDAHQVWLDVGRQHFTVGEYLETKDEAEWLANQLRIAIGNMKALQAPIAVTDALTERAATYRKLAQIHDESDGYTNRQSAIIYRKCADEIEAALAQPKGAQDGNVS